MKSALIISHTKRSIAFFVEILNKFDVNNILTVTTGDKAKQLIYADNFDLVIVNSPLSNDDGYGISKQIAKNGVCQVILIVNSELYDEVSEAMEPYGIITIGKPLNKNLFELALKLSRVTQARIREIQNKNVELVQKIADIKVIDRAKFILVSYFNMSEQEAHKYIERQAMDTRKTKRIVAENLLKTYEN